jgi:hypothetical protein
MDPKPPRGSFQHTEWMVKDIREVAAKLGVPVRSLTREVYLSGSPEATRTDTDHYSWTKIRQLASAAHRKSLGIRGPLADGEVPVDPLPEEYFLKKITTKVGPDGEILEQSLKAAIQQASGDLVDPVPDGHSISGISTLVSGDGKTLLQWVKTKSGPESREQTLARLVAALPEIVPTREGSIPAPVVLGGEGLLAVYPVGDPHVGMYATAQEAGELWDTTKAVHVHQRAMDALVLHGTPCENSLLINLGDFFHADTQKNTTTKGTPVDTAGRYHEILEAGLAMKIYMVDVALSRHKYVTVWCRMGNHDRETALFLAIALRQHYRNEPRVTIEVNAGAADYMRWGKCLIAATHGDTYKANDLESIMSVDRASDWGETEHRFWYLGHVHHKTQREHRGCVVETFRTLASKDAWHTSAGYRSKRDISRIVLHKEFGEVGRSVVSAAMVSSE